MTAPRLDISIIVPVHNKADVLERVIAAAADQSLASERYEIVVVDDHSHDGSAALIHRLAAGYDHVRRVDRKPGPPGAARTRNSAIAAARGDWALLLDADVLVHRDLCADCLAFARGAQDDARVGLVPTHGASTTQNTWPFQAPPPPLRPADLAAGHWHAVADARPPLEGLKAPWVFFWTTAVLVSRARLLMLGGLDEALEAKGSEDIELGYRLHQEGGLLAWVPTAPVLHLPHRRNRKAEEATDRAHERHMLARHRSVEMEMLCAFDAGHAEDALTHLSRLQPAAAFADLWSALPPHGRELGRALAFFAQSRGLRAWLGPCLALTAGAPAEDADSAPFFGLALPHEDSAFDTAILPDLRGVFPEALICRLFQEAKRVARDVLYLRIDTPEPREPLITDRLFASFDRPYWERTVRLSRHYHDWRAETLAALHHPDGTTTCTLVRVCENTPER
ncbi:glycosyltransferase [Xanthobacteraceae bacterium A53D]